MSKKKKRKKRERFLFSHVGKEPDKESTFNIQRKDKILKPLGGEKGKRYVNATFIYSLPRTSRIGKNTEKKIKGEKLEGAFAHLLVLGLDTKKRQTALSLSTSHKR